jgi:hypothetical protein
MEKVQILSGINIDGPENEIKLIGSKIICNACLSEQLRRHISHL